MAKALPDSPDVPADVKSRLADFVTAFEKLMAAKAVPNAAAEPGDRGAPAKGGKPG